MHEDDSYCARQEVRGDGLRAIVRGIIILVSAILVSSLIALILPSSWENPQFLIVLLLIPPTLLLIIGGLVRVVFGWPESYGHERHQGLMNCYVAIPATIFFGGAAWLLYFLTSEFFSWSAIAWGMVAVPILGYLIGLVQMIFGWPRFSLSRVLDDL